MPLHFIGNKKYNTKKTVETFGKDRKQWTKFIADHILYVTM